MYLFHLKMLIQSYKKDCSYFRRGNDIILRVFFLQKTQGDFAGYSDTHAFQQRVQLAPEHQVQVQALVPLNTLGFSLYTKT